MSKQELYLAFINLIGNDSEGNFIYRVDFTDEPESVWGDEWNYTPCGSIPKISPDNGTIAMTSRLISKEEFLLATKNTCFSMQDCIDGILPLLFSELPSSNILILSFGDSIDCVKEKLEAHGLSLSDIKQLNSEDSIISKAMEQLSTDNNNQDDNDDEEDDDLEF